MQSLVRACDKMSDLNKHLKKNSASKLVKYWGLQFFGTGSKDEPKSKNVIDKERIIY